MPPLEIFDGTEIEKTGDPKFYAELISIHNSKKIFFKMLTITNLYVYQKVFHKISFNFQFNFS